MVKVTVIKKLLSEAVKVMALALMVLSLPSWSEDTRAQQDPHAHHQHEQASATKSPDTDDAESETIDHSHHMHHGHHGDHKMTLDEGGMVMNWNRDELPRDCSEISRNYEFTVRAGTKYAAAFSGNIYGLDTHEWRVAPCSRLTVTFINEDEIRHQWMVHNLPRYLYPQGMFHLEAAGGQQKTGTFIVPSDDRTYLVHCDVAQHMEMGMKAQLVVGKGSQDLPSVPGVTSQYRPDGYDGLDEPLRKALVILSFMIVLLIAYKLTN